MARVTALLAVTLSLSALAYAPQRLGGAPLDPEREARVQRIGKELRCAVCQGVAIADSPASMARAQLEKVRELVAEGKSDEEIKAYFVERYGEWVLLRPKAEGMTLLVWVLPGLLLLFGFVIIFAQIRRAPAGAAQAAEAPETPAEDDYLKAVRAELEK